MIPDAHIPGLFAFEDVAHVGAKVALRLRIGPRAGHRDVTFAELRQLAAARAGALSRRGAAPGQRVALLMPHGEHLVTTFFGALWAGMIPSIVAWPTAKMDPEKYRRNLHAVLGSLGAQWLATDAVTAAGLGAALGDTRVVDLSDEAPNGAPPPAIRAQGTAFIQFSGGTTGPQKSVPISFDDLARQLAALGLALGLRDDDAVISWLPLYHDMGLVACLLMPFVHRLPVTMFAPMEWVLDPRPFLRAIGEHAATLCWLPNFAFSFMAARARVRPGELDLSSMRAFVDCSEPVRAESLDAFAAAFAPHGLSPSALHASYAMAEATFAVTQTSLEQPPRRLVVSREAFGAGRLEVTTGPGRTLVSCGPPLAGIELRVVDESGGDCPAGAIGEIRLRGEFVMDDYLDAERSERGARWAFADGWYRTGDLGALLDGHLYVTGRQKDLIIVGGVNVYPEDVESAVGEVEGVHAGRVVALGIEGEGGTERLVVVAELDRDEDPTRAAAIEAEVRSTVLLVAGTAAHRVFLVPPRWIVKSTAGKISRVETKHRLLDRWAELNPGERA